MRDEAKRLIAEIIRERMTLEQDDWLSFPDDFPREQHPVHYLREALTEIEGGRYPSGFSSTFMNSEFEQYRQGKCGWQVQGYPTKYCGEPVETKAVSTSLGSTYCRDHAKEAITDYYG